MSKFLTPISIVIAGLLISGSVLITNEKLNFPQIPGLSNLIVNKVTSPSKTQIEPVNTAPSVPPAPAAPPQPKSLSDGDFGTNPVLGSSSAKVALSEFGDYQCPFCVQFASVVMPKLKKDYIDTGLVKFVYRDFAFLGPESKDASLASRCASDQGKYWQYHDYLYKYIANKEASNPGISQENVGNFSVLNLKSFAKALGLNTSKFNSCFDSRKYDKQILDDVTAAQNYSVNSTPTVFINGKYFNSNYGFDGFTAAIEAELKK
jgi:protein-disulfide isomerase